MPELAQIQHENNKPDKQIGCMSTFLHIFGKRIHSAKRLPPAIDVGASLETVSLVQPETEDNADNSQLYRQKISPAKEMRTVDRDYYECRPASVIARLTGLEPLTSDQKPPQTVTKPALSRSGSESRVSSHVFRPKYIDEDSFQVKKPNQSQKLEYVSDSLKSELMSQRFIDSSEFFPNRTKVTVIMHGDLEKKLKMRGMDEEIANLSTLKQIAEVLQLKGLPRSTDRSNREIHRNLESNIHLKQSRSLTSKLDQQRTVNARGAIDQIPVSARTKSSSKRIESNLKSCNSIIKRKPLSIEIEKRANESSSDSLRRSPITPPKKTGSVHHPVTDRSPRSESIASACSTTDSQRSEWEGCREGGRCGELVGTESSPSSESSTSSGTVLPSPVSVLDSGFDKDESLSPSLSIDFKGNLKAIPTVDFENNNQQSTKSSDHDDSDFIYITKILGSSQHLLEDPNAFLLIEKQLYDTENDSNVSKRQPKLVFDLTLELLNKNRDLFPWKPSIECPRTLIRQIWFEFQKLREVKSEDGFISGVLKRDLVEIKEWGDYPIETSEAVLDVERMIFKDLVSEVIGDLIKFSGECMFSRTRRRLVF